jgi:hypothetical protein
MKRQLSGPNMLRDPKVHKVYRQLREEQESAGNVPLSQTFDF